MPGFFQVDVPAQCIAQDMRGVSTESASGCEVVIKRLAIIRVHTIIDDDARPLPRRQALDDYFTAACALGGHTPHILRDALSWHINLEETGQMLKK